MSSILDMQLKSLEKIHERLTSDNNYSARAATKSIAKEVHNALAAINEELASLRDELEKVRATVPSAVAFSQSASTSATPANAE